MDLLALNSESGILNYVTAHEVLKLSKLSNSKGQDCTHILGSLISEWWAGAKGHLGHQSLSAKPFKASINKVLFLSV